jgi:hypothetical protein
MPVADVVVAMLITCSVTAGCTVCKLYACKRFEMQEGQIINIAHRVMQIIDIRIEQLQSKRAL